MKRTGTWVIIFLVLFLAWAGVRIGESIKFDNGCEGYINRAAHAGTVAIAIDELDQAIAYATRNNLTEGIVSIFWKNPINDLGFWFNNLVDVRAKLAELPKDVTPLEESNVMLRLHETLINSNGGVAHPDGISVYPHNLLYMLWGTLSFLGLVILFIKYF